MVVDDEFNNRLALSRRLTRRGYSVDTAEGAAEALDKLLRQQYDLVLLDQMMPGMSGLDLLKLLRATYSPTELPVIMVTAVDENETMAEALNQGANDYVVKPVEMPEITARIQTQLARSRVARRQENGEGAVGGTSGRDATWEWDPQSGTARYSAEWAHLLGHVPGEIGNRLEEWLDRIHPQDLVRVRREIKTHLDGGASEFRSEHRLRCKSGAYRWVSCRAVAFLDSEGRLIHMAGVAQDIEQRKVVDTLTGLGNRLQVLDRLSRVLSESEDPQVVMLVDLDDFGILNEHSGHERADSVLVEVATRLKEAIADPDLIPDASLSRVGSDEFAIVARIPHGAADVHFLADVLLASFAEPVTVDGEAVQVTASIGAAMTVKGITPDQMLRDADLALRKAKEQGRHNWKLYESGLRDRAHIRATLARDLRHVIERNQLLVVYQPKVGLRSGTIVGFEALMRWKHPELGLVSPIDFIPMAEETGMILAAGEWIMRKACRQLKQWQEEFPDGDRPLEMSVNLSARQLSDPNLKQIVERALADARIEPSSLALELTESSLIEEKESARGVLGDLQKLGVGLMLDDFGTGYASLSYLSMLRFDALKIDRSFVGRLDSDADSCTIIRTVMGLAKELRMDVIAEGIETESQLRRLVEMGCPWGQGFYFSKPIEAREAQALLSRGFAPLPGAPEVQVA